MSGSRSTPLGPGAPADVLDGVALVRAARRRPARRTRLVVGGLAAALVGAVLVRVTLGDYVVTLPDVVRILAGTDIPGASYVLLESKLPRAVLGVLVGAALGLAGAVFQTTLRNPLASPDVVGVGAGASAAAVWAVVVLDQRGAGLALAAVLGAVATALLVRWQAGPGAGARLVLVGVGVSAALLSVVQHLFTRADEWDTQLVLRWLTGSLNGVDWGTIRLLAVLLAVLVPAVALLARASRAAELGADTAAGLGVTARHADALLLVAVLLVGVAVAAAGPVAFVSFLAGPIARALNGGRVTLVGSALVGAVVVVAADHAAAYALPGVNLPVGVVTGAVGAPVLLWLLATGRTSRRSR